MYTLDERIELSKRQRELIASGKAPSGAEDLLAAFERSQAIFEEDLERLLRERDGK